MSGILRLPNGYKQIKNTLIFLENYILQSFKNNFFKHLNKDFIQQLSITHNYFNLEKKRNNYPKTAINWSFGLIDKLLLYSRVKQLILIIIKGNISQFFELYSHAANRTLVLSSLR
ncbi:MAG: hypothetical protein CMM67_10060 [Rhodospirillaceae bacterium]|nr:hypothetical protein [Rhodospirillaceae bacterium]OUT77059.1 MAG: hypothetical protein CBB83_10240 [Rhodospirillaceae bacterium TMED23]